MRRLRMVAMLAIAAVAVTALLPDMTAAQGRARGRKGGAKKRAAAPAWPPFEVRHSEWVRRREQAIGGAADPEPLTQYLVGEVIVTGVFATEDGYGVFLLGTPTGNTFFARPGAALYNGRLVEVRGGAGGDAEDSEIVFVERPSRGGPERPVVKRVEQAPDPAPPEPAAPQPRPVTSRSGPSAELLLDLTGPLRDY